MLTTDLSETRLSTDRFDPLSVHTFHEFSARECDGESPSTMCILSRAREESTIVSDLKKEDYKTDKMKG